MTRRDVRRTLVAYDIPNDKRRARVAKALSGYGDRVQYSVFVVDASPARTARMRRAVGALIDDREDSVLMCDLGLASAISGDRFAYMGVHRAITDSESFVV